MKKLEHLLGLLAGIGFAGTVLLSLNAAANLIYRVSTGDGPKAELAQPAGQDAQDQGAEETGEPAPGTVAAAEPPAPSAAGIDLAAGEKVFKKCAACHTAGKDGANRTGPNLWGILNRPVAAHAGFAYSEAMAAQSGESWSAERLDIYLSKPKDIVPGTSMAFAGLPKSADRHNLIAWLGAQSDTPVAPDALPFGGATQVADNAEAPTEPEEDPIAQIAYANPPDPTAEELAAIAAKVAALTGELPGLDYERARHHPLHFPPAIDSASNAECLVCHQEIMTAKPRDESPAGVKAADSLAWYQTLDTYMGDQESFHFRHLQSDFAQEVMDLKCNFCHRGNDPREESPDMMPLRAAFSAGPQPEFTNRKMVNPETTCLRCHGAMPDPVGIMGLPGPWHEARRAGGNPEAPNMTKGAGRSQADLSRAIRHNVTYLRAANIEALAKEVSSDTCHGCHGGRQWYRTAYPYPRHAWPGMDPEPPEWVAGRPTQSDEAYRLPTAAGQ